MGDFCCKVGWFQLFQFSGKVLPNKCIYSSVSCIFRKGAVFFLFLFFCCHFCNFVIIFFVFILLTLEMVLYSLNYPFSIVLWPILQTYWVLIDSFCWIFMYFLKEPQTPFTKPHLCLLVCQSFLSSHSLLLLSVTSLCSNSQSCHVISNRAGVAAAAAASYSSRNRHQWHFLPLSFSFFFNHSFCHIRFDFHAIIFFSFTQQFRALVKAVDAGI